MLFAPFPSLFWKKRPILGGFGNFKSLNTKAEKEQREFLYLLFFSPL